MINTEGISASMYVIYRVSQSGLELCFVDFAFLIMCLTNSYRVYFSRAMSSCAVEGRGTLFDWNVAVNWELGNETDAEEFDFARLCERDTFKVG